MPVSPTYPGVYIEEIPSGVRTITGVATSITAFAGWAPKGPTELPELILSWADFDRKFGGLVAESYLGHAVSQFFANGGQKAYIIRLAAADAKASEATLDGKLKVTARNAGDWGDDYAIVTKQRQDDKTRFQLKVARIKDHANGSDIDIPKGVFVEVFEDLSMDSSDRRFVEGVLKSESSLVTAQVLGGATDPPADTVIPPKGDPKEGVIPDGAKLTGGKPGAVLSPGAGLETALAVPGGPGGLLLLDRIDLFNLLCVPGLTDAAKLGDLQKFCRDRRAFLIADCGSDANFDKLSQASGPDSNLTKADAINAAFYFPWISAPDPLQQNRPKDFPPCGFVAGLYARTDTNRGVWKAPAGTEASLTGVYGPSVTLTNDENGVLNPLAVNCIRALPVYGTVLWGARTLQGNDERGSEWKYIPVRRTALFIEETLFRALKWVVFEPNDEPLWAQIRLNVGAFMHDLFRQGAFQGQTPKDAYFVKCDKETTTQSDINRGIVNIIVGFAPLKPAEFVIVKIQQIAGQIET
jgi:phage tail sheath protein FI